MNQVLSPKPHSLSMQNKILLLLAMLIATPTMGAAQTSKEEKARICQSDPLAKKLKGEARRGFIEECMAEPLDSELTPQQRKSKACNQKATDQGLRGDNRKGFIAKCLAGQ